MTRSPSTPDCSIKGCTRAAHKGFLCREHYRLVPYSMTKECASEVMDTAYAIGKKHHRKQLAFVRRQLAA